MAGSSGTKQKILIIDDEPHILQMLEMNMRNNGYACLTASTGESGLSLAEEYVPNLVLLDVMLPGLGGIEICRRIKDNPRTGGIPVIMLSAKSEGKDKIDGFKGGADDYITKPFSLEELFLRIAANLRQVEMLKSSVQPVPVIMGNLSVDTVRYQASADGRKIDLTLTEFRILSMLLARKEELVPREVFAREVFEKNTEESSRSLDVHVRNIRRKLTDMNIRGCRIETVRGAGLRITGD